jgi:hypothetical protein
MLSCRYLQAEPPAEGGSRSVAGAGIYVNMRFGDYLGSSQIGCELSGQFRNYIESLSGIADTEVRSTRKSDRLSRGS